MQPIQMVDLKRQYEKIKSEVNAAIQGVIDSTAFIAGPDVREFSRELAAYLGVRHVIPCANGTDALQIALMALDLQPGDEVITPSFTFTATAEVIGLLRLKPVFVDVDEAHFTMDPEAVRKAITGKTKAIIPVHLYGQSAEMEPLLEISRHYGIPLVEDNAQAIGGEYLFADGTRKKTGAMGMVGCTSFFPSKNLGCYGDGGAMFTNDDALAERLQMIANHGQKVRYYHEMIGCNSRLDSIQAAVLRIKLRHLDAYCKARQAAAAYYDEAFSGQENLVVPYRTSYSTHVFHQYTLKLLNTDRDAVVKEMAERNIPTMIYYPVPCHKQKMFESLLPQMPMLPVTEVLQEQVISLPMHTELTEAELAFISNHFLDIVQKHSR